MKTEDFKELKRIVKAYRDKKNEVRNQVIALDKKAHEGVDYWWNVDEMKNDLYKDLIESSERQAFIKEADKTKTDSEFEKYFRSAAMEYFLGIKIDPVNL